MTNARDELRQLQQWHRHKLRLAIDAGDVDSLPTTAQDEVFRDTATLIHWVIASNRSGKSAVGGKVTAWWFEENHPYAERPKAWGEGPLQLLVIGRLGEQMESELWAKKIQPFLQPGTYKVVRIGNVIQRVEHRTNGNRIVFLSHHDAANAREKVQAFTAHVVWLDEMPDHAGLVSELLMRVLTTEGYLYATFTPLIRNEEIRKIVETPRPNARKHVLRMLDNPKFLGREAEVEAEVRAACASEAEFMARMFGEWYQGDLRVFAYDRTRNFASVPANYERTVWRHIAVVDPAASGTAGLTIWGESPDTGAWYNTHAVYLKGSAAYELLDEVERSLVGYNVLWRLCDCNPAGFYREAMRRNIPWVPFTDKTDRKLETIDKLNEAFGRQRVWLTEESHRLEDELVKASWAEGGKERIVNASSYHLIDTARYAIDSLPAFDPNYFKQKLPADSVRAQWKARQAKQEQRAMAIVSRRSMWNRRVSR